MLSRKRMEVSRQPTCLLNCMQEGPNVLGATPAAGLTASINKVTQAAWHLKSKVLQSGLLHNGDTFKNKSLDALLDNQIVLLQNHGDFAVQSHGTNVKAYIRATLYPALLQQQGVTCHIPHLEGDTNFVVKCRQWQDTFATHAHVSLARYACLTMTSVLGDGAQAQSLCTPPLFICG